MTIMRIPRTTWTRRVGLTAALALAASVPGVAPTTAATSTVLIGGLSSPAAFTVASGGRVFYSELLSGVVKLWNPTTRRATTFFTIPNGAGRQTLGMALNGGFLYLYSARLVSGVSRLQLSRVTVSGDVGTGFRVLRDFGVRPQEHSGGPIRFGPDGMLYLSSGDHDNAANAQNRASDFGKILRMTPTGGIPAGASSRVYAYGIRNSFGFDFDRRTNRMWATDNGPECNDEVNLITRGGNHGWGPSATCTTPPLAPRNTNQDGPSPVLPKRHFVSSVAPTGAVFSGGALLYGTFNTRQIRKVTLTANQLGVARDTVLLSHSAPVLTLQQGAAGQVYFADTSSIRLLG